MLIRRERKLNRLKGYDYSQDGFYFVTICVQDRKCFFGDVKNGQMELSIVGKEAEKCWLEIPNHFPDAKLDEFVVMPNHIHGIIAIIRNKNFCSVRTENKNIAVGNKNIYSQGQNKNIYSVVVVGNENIHSVVGNKNIHSPWQKKWARSISSMVRGFKIGVTKWCRQNNYGNFKWQKSFYDHIIRDERSLYYIREYIKNNPLKWETDRNSL